MQHPYRLLLPTREIFDPIKEEFSVIGGLELELEYSLYTISLWESKWKKPFVPNSDKLTVEEEIGLYEAMCLTPGVDRLMWSLLTLPLKNDIFEYMSDPMSATTVNARNKKPGRRKIITTEVIYYWMSSFNIPYSCEHWHLNRLLKLIEVASIEQTPPKKMSKKEAAMQYRNINEARKAMWNTKG